MIEPKRQRDNRPLFLLSRARRRSASFVALHPRVVASAGAVRDSIAAADRHSLWVSYDRALTDVLLRSVCGPSRPLGRAVFVHPLNPPTIPALVGWFPRFAFAASEQFLPPEELAEALGAEHAEDLFIGGSVNSDNQTLTLWRGNLESLTVPFSAFETSGDGLAPDFKSLSMTDSGQTLRLGNYEAAADAILYEFDPDYRRRAARRRQDSEKSFGASLRRLRKQRGLRRIDFEPDIASKTIARIEQGKVQRIQQKTLNVIARKLRVNPDELATF